MAADAAAGGKTGATAPSDVMPVVRQTDFTASKGNALQACIATMLRLPLDEVPNFIAAPGGYEGALSAFLAQRGLGWHKVLLGDAGSFADAGAADRADGALVLLRGKSPRGDHAHIVVARVDAAAAAAAAAAGGGGEQKPPFAMVADPHPDDTFLDGAPNWAGFLVALDPVAVAAAASTTTTAAATQ